MSWFGKHVKVASFDEREGRLSVDEYVEKVNQSKSDMCAESEHKLRLHKELVSILDNTKTSLKEKGVDVSFKEVVDNIYIPEILIVSPLGNVTYFTYKEEDFTIWFDGEIV